MTTLLCLVMSMAAIGQNLPQEQVAQIENRVRNYCSLIERFSASPDGALLLPEVEGSCENQNVQTFDDLSDNKDAGYNSVPLQKYLMKVTTDYDNSLKVKYSDFKYEKTIRQPALSKELGEVCYALVGVTKTIKGKGISRKLKLRVSINIQNGKVGGTVSSEYEDPGRMYQDALEQIGNGMADNAAALLKKCSSYPTYPGRYKALSVLGNLYYQKKDYVSAIDVLRQCCDSHPLGGIWLSAMYLDKRVPYRLRDRHEALRLLEKYAGKKDDDFPEAQLQAAFSLAQVYMGDYDLPRNEAKAKMAIDKAIELADADDTPCCKMYRPTLRMMRYAFVMAYEDVSLEEQVKYLSDLGNDIDKWFAEPAYNDVRHANIANVYLMSALAYENSNIFEHALGFAKTALAEAGKISDENTRSLLQKEYERQIGKLYVRNKRFGEAFKWYSRQAEERNSGLANWYMYRYYSDDKLPPDATSFEKYLNEDRGQKNAEKATNYLLKAADYGSLDANKMTSIFLVFQSGNIDNVKLGVRKYLLWYCDRTEYNSIMSLSLMSALVGQIIDNKQYELLDVLKENSAASGSANFILGYFYNDSKSPFHDPKKGVEYYEKGAKLHNFYCSQFLAYGYLDGSIAAKDTLMAQRVFAGMADCNYPEAYYALGDIQKDQGHLKEAIGYFYDAYDLGDMFAPAALAELYAEGNGVERDVAKAIRYYEETCQRLVAHGGIEKDIAEYKEKIRKLRQENPALADDGSYVAGLLVSVADSSRQPDERISLSEKVLAEVFASPGAVVEIIGSNGKTLVAKKTAEDYLLELATHTGKASITIVEAKRNAAGKVESLKVTSSPR